MDRNEVIERYKERRAIRLDAAMNEDGGDGSGNWGHVGRIGERGGSMPGGGLAFRGTKTRAPKHAGEYKKAKDGSYLLDAKGKRIPMKNKWGQRLSAYDSKAKTRERIRMDYEKAIEKDDYLRKWDIEERMEKTDMERKSVRHLKEKGEYSATASSDILSDKTGRGKSATREGVKMTRALKKEMDK